MGNDSKKILKIYLWQFVALILNFISLFIVVPLISDNKEIYGIYSFCISLLIFFTYADLGFINAGVKFASEAYSSHDTYNEHKYIGFSIFVFSCIVLILMTIALLCYWLADDYLLKLAGNNQSNYVICKQLLVILIASTPITIIQKFVQVIYNVRLADYKIQRMYIIASLAKIVSVPLIFFNGKYDIVGYYTFCQIVLMVVNIILLYKSKEEGYGLLSIFRCCRFSLSTFRKLKNLALSGLLASVSWIVFFELDNIVIGAKWGAVAIAVYAIGLSIQSVVRSIMAVLYAPFNVKFNYYIGQNDEKGLNILYQLLVKYFALVIVVPLLAIIILSKPFVLSWVGDKYSESVSILQWMITLFIFNVVNNPTNYLLIAHNKAFLLAKIALWQPVILWISFFFFSSLFGLLSLPMFKVFSMLIVTFFCIKYASGQLGISKSTYIYNLIVKPYTIPCITCLLLSVGCLRFLPINKDPKNLFIVIAAIIAVSIITWIISFLVSKQLRNSSMSLYYSIRR